MKRRSLALILATGTVAGALAFAGASWFQTRPHRQLLRDPEAELAWLRHEFGLTDAQFRRVQELHAAYRPTCSELCRRIEEANRRLREAVAATNTVTDTVRERLRETGEARDACRQAMLNHLYSVARELPPAAGRRYLDSMLAATCVLQEARPLHAPAAPASGATPAHHHEP